ncbi:kinase-like domain-containing protein, partial [Phellopilus nigrolimitatus]
DSRDPSSFLPPQVIVQPPSPMETLGSRLNLSNEEISSPRTTSTSPIAGPSSAANTPTSYPDSTSIGASDEETQRPSLPESKFWTYTHQNKIYQIPDVTNMVEAVEKNERESDKKLQGGFGVVRKGFLKDQTPVAIKTMKLASNVFLSPKANSEDTMNRKRFRSEAATWLSLDHPNVLRLIGFAELDSFHLGPSLVSPWMPNKDSLTYVQEHPEVRRLPIILGTIKGIAYLHEQGVIHGDIKGRNIVMSDLGVPQICDFGLASFVDSDDRAISKSLMNAGTTQWMAYELHMSETPGKEVSAEADMWAFGMVIIELLTGNYPFQENRSQIIFLRIERRLFPPRPDSVECSEKLWDLTQRCWNKKPTERPKAKDALEIIHSLCPVT